jgi:hypothetical protein
MVPDDPTDPGTLRESGAQIRSLMREASAAGARLVQFPEGAITYPSKRVMSSQGPDRVASSDWSRVDWNVLRSEAQAIADLAGELRIPDIDVARRLARPWRRTARAGLYDERVVRGDPRSEVRTTF